MNACPRAGSAVPARPGLPSQPFDDPDPRGGRAFGAVAYRRLVRRRLGSLATLAALLLLVLVLDVALGPARYPLAEVLRALFAPASVDLQLRTVVWDIRLPMAAMAIVVGASLSLAGAQMQTILVNPLASPFTLGISAAAAFGAALAMVLGVALVPGALVWMVPINAFLLAMAASLLIFAAASLPGFTSETLVLLGIALVFTFNAALALLESLASEQALAAVVFWTMGSLNKADWSKVAVTTAALAFCAPLFARRAWALTAIRLGQTRAAALGVPVRRLRLQVFVLVSLLAAVPVAFVGTMGFMGIVGPHIARLLLGEGQRFFLPGSMLTGALVLSATSVLAKLVLPGAVLPIGVVTVLVGVPFFVALVLGRRGRAWRRSSWSGSRPATASGSSSPTCRCPSSPVVSSSLSRERTPPASRPSSVVSRGISPGVGRSGSAAASLRYMPQDSGAVAALTVYEAVILALKQGRRDWRLAPAERAAVEAVLARLDIEVLASRPLGELSGGQRQLVSLAQTLVGRPGVVLLDEPTSALDLARQYEVLALLRGYAAEEGAVVVVALHDLNQVLRSCSTTVALAEGRILAAGPTAEVLTPETIARLYGVRARIERCSRGRPVLIVDGPLGADGPARGVARPRQQ